MMLAGVPGAGSCASYLLVDPNSRLTALLTLQEVDEARPGVRLTLSKRGASVSGGPKGAKLSTNTRGEKRASAGLFGAFWRKKL
jgi:Protein of unknown function (DUF4236)